MPSHIIQSLLLAGVWLATSASALNAQLVGTWSTKSAKVLTGPGFYDPVNDKFIEPSHTGISYSFTVDGFYEEAYYRTIANPTKPACPQAVLQFQHGTVTENEDGSLSFSPIAVDGRQLMSNPCASGHGVYTRYNQTETMKKFQVYIDPYTKMTRLDLYKFDGSPMNPMFLAYTPPQMLPTVTMNPDPTATTTAKKVKRTPGAIEVEELAEPLNKHAMHIKREGLENSLLHRIDLDMFWWAGVGMMLFGGAAYML